jgi:hypothetical protein
VDNAEDGSASRTLATDLMVAPAAQHSEPGYAQRLADDSFRWYKTAAIRARRAYKIIETLLLLVSASIPVSAVVSNSAVTPAILGSVTVVLAGARAIFHWQENYLRFSEAREAVEAERRLYHTWSIPYDNAETRDTTLVKAITNIEQSEMQGWVRVAVTRPSDTAGTALRSASQSRADGTRSDEPV